MGFPKIFPSHCILLQLFEYIYETDELPCFRPSYLATDRLADGLAQKPTAKQPGEVSDGLCPFRTLKRHRDITLAEARV